MDMRMVLFGLDFDGPFTLSNLYRHTLVGYVYIRGVLGPGHL
jgi:hypothetical protein